MLTPLDCSNLWTQSVVVTKRQVATARARAALAGFTMHPIFSDGGPTQFLQTKWNLTREFADLAEVAAFLDQAGARDA